MNSSKLCICSLFSLIALNSCLSVQANPFPPEPAIRDSIRQQNGQIYDIFKQTSTQNSEVLPGAVLQIEERRRYVDPNELKAKPKDNFKEEEINPEANENASEAKVLINEVNIEGDTLLRRYETDHIINQYLGREITFSDLQDMTQELTNLYKRRGYVTSRIYLPPQKIEDGILTLKATEGIIKPITLEEGHFFKARSIFPRLRVDQYDVLDLNKIKNDLARLNENPDMGLQAVLKQGQNMGETELRLKTQDRFPLHFTPFIDNLGRRLIGEERYGFGITHNNLFGFGDRNITSFYATRSSFGVANNYEIPIGKYGTKLGFNYSHGRLKLGKEFDDLDIKGFATLYSPYIFQELFRNKNFIASTDLAFDFKNLGTDILDQKFTRERLRILRPGFNFDEFDRFGRTFMRHEIGWGIDALDASGKNRPLNGRAGTGPNFFRYTGYGTRITQLPFGIQDVFRVTGQYSDDLLNSAEQIQVGGAFTVRGYKEGQLIGDSGFALSNELRFPLYFIPRSWKFNLNKNGIPTALMPARAGEPTSTYSLLENIQLVGFTDFGGVFVNNSVRPIKANAYALGSGVGLRMRLTKFLIGRIDLGFPLIRNLPERHDMAIHFGVQSELF